jgi:hypothetical protein
MTDTQKIPWNRISVEAVAIVASILFAFAIDAWWSERQLAAENQDLLSQLKLEFETNSTLLEERRSRHVQMLAALRNLLAATGPNPENKSFSASEIKQDLYVTLGWWTFDPQRGVLDSIIQSGKLSIIRSDQLRTNLASWPALIQDFAEDEAFIVSYTREFVYPLYQRELVLRDIGPLSDTGSSQFSWDPSDILASRQFENVVQQKFVLTQEVLAYTDALNMHIKETLALIQEANQ